MRTKLAAFTAVALMTLGLTLPSVPAPTVASAQEAGDSAAAQLRGLAA